ncbi:MAG TPA: hypothetical protein VFI11_13660 [Anaerolineales bacterium]|nr:hypothetical protein [Anaerolineales bacterium]
MVAYTYPVWLFFAAFFFYNAYTHWREGEIAIRPFSMRDKPGEKPGAQSKLTDANQEFVREFNSYLTSVNKTGRGRHRAIAIGYTLSGVIALASMFLILAGQ